MRSNSFFSTMAASQSFFSSLTGACEKPPKLPDLKQNYMNQSSVWPQYTIVLDLDETLLHTQWIPNRSRYIVHERPFARFFLEALKELPVEVVIFTAGVQCYADTVIDVMDKKTRAIHHRLYRQHTSILSFQRFKDLSLLNRDLNKTVLIDNTPEMFLKQPDNGIGISSWEGYEKIGEAQDQITYKIIQDRALLYLFYWIEYLVSSKMSVPEFLRTNRAAIFAAIGSGSSRAPSDYVPSFKLGPKSVELTRRCEEVESNKMISKDGSSAGRHAGEIHPIYGKKDEYRNRRRMDTATNGTSSTPYAVVSTDTRKGSAVCTEPLSPPATTQTVFHPLNRSGPSPTNAKDVGRPVHCTLVQHKTKGVTNIPDRTVLAV